MQARGRACLVQYSGGSLGRRYYLDPPSSTLGRSTSATIMLLHESVSRQHARCTVMADQVSVEDLGSANGTYVNEERIREPATLKDGDLLRAIAEHVWGRPDLDPTAITPLGPDEAATVLDDALLRRRFHEVVIALDPPAMVRESYGSFTAAWREAHVEAERHVDHDDPGERVQQRHGMEAGIVGRRLGDR